MGSLYQARCLSCSKDFELSEGGGFQFELLRCDQCGETQSVKRNDDEPSPTAKCPCGGSFTVNAAARCPNCKSTNVQKQRLLLLYD